MRPHVAYDTVGLSPDFYLDLIPGEGSHRPADVLVRSCPHRVLRVGIYCAGANIAAVSDQACRFRRGWGGPLGSCDPGGRTLGW